MRDRESPRHLVGRERRRALVAAGSQQVGEEGLEHAEPLGRDGADRALGERLTRVRALRACDAGRLAVVVGLEHVERLVHRLDQLVRLERNRSSVLTEDPAREELDVGEIGLEDAVLDDSSIPEGALDPPRRVLGHGDSRPADGVADLPRPRDAMLLDVEVRRSSEVPLPACGEPDVTADARHLERPRGVAIEVVADRRTSCRRRVEGRTD